MTIKSYPKSNKVIILHEYFAQCPNCGETDWQILLDKPDFEFTTIVAFRCSECNYEVLINITERKLD